MRRRSATLTSCGGLRFATFARCALLRQGVARDQKAVACGNRLLAAFESESRAWVDHHLERAEFKLGDVVCEAGGLLNHAYFPDGAVLSLLTVLENGTAIETANIGREGRGIG
jgi:hypothetical protein